MQHPSQDTEVATGYGALPASYQMDTLG